VLFRELPLYRPTGTPCGLTSFVNSAQANRAWKHARLQPDEHPLPIRLTPCRRRTLLCAHIENLHVRARRCSLVKLEDVRLGFHQITQFLESVNDSYPRWSRRSSSCGDLLLLGQSCRWGFGATASAMDSIHRHRPGNLSHCQSRWLPQGRGQQLSQRDRRNR